MKPLLIATTIALISTSPAQAGESVKKPNIIVILADDEDLANKDLIKNPEFPRQLAGFEHGKDRPSGPIDAN